MFLLQLARGYTSQTGSLRYTPPHDIIAIPTYGEHFKEIQPQGYHNYSQLDHQKIYQWSFPYISERQYSVKFLEDTRKGTWVISFIIVGSTSWKFVGKKVCRDFLKFRTDLDSIGIKLQVPKGTFWVVHTSFLQRVWGSFLNPKSSFLPW